MYHRMAAAKTVVRFMRKMKIKNLKQLRRVFRAFKQVLRGNLSTQYRAFRNKAASKLQKLLRRCFAVHLARRKARQLRMKRKYATDIQRVFRGFKGRKDIFWKYRVHFLCMIAFRNLGRKIILLQSAQRLHLK